MLGPSLLDVRRMQSSVMYDVKLNVVKLNDAKLNDVKLKQVKSDKG